jgi:hypothetical protein
VRRGEKSEILHCTWKIVYCIDKTVSSVNFGVTKINSSFVASAMLKLHDEASKITKNDIEYCLFWLLCQSKLSHFSFAATFSTVTVTQK